MARRFTSASSEKVTLGIGNLGFAFGPGTIAAVFRMTTLPGAGAFPMIFTAGAVLTTGYGLYVNGDQAGDLSSNINNTDSIGPQLAASVWYCGGYTKATGSVAPRFHLYNYSTNAWTHTAGGSAQANSGTPITKAQMGADGTPTAGLFFNGDLAACAVWNVELTDAQFESLQSNVSRQNWGGYTAPRGMWIPDPSPAVTVLDLTGGGANESAITGTTATPDDFPPLRPGNRARQYVT